MVNSAVTQFFPDDIFLVSYPRSGNTWFRFLICNYLTGKKNDFFSSLEIIPDLHYNPEAIQQLKQPRIIKSHLPYTQDYKRVVYLVRDGRDVAVSYYYFALKFHTISKETTFEEFLMLFNQGAIDSFTPWSHHVSSWLDSSKEDLLLIRYEDIQLDCERELIRFLKFAMIPIDHERVALAAKLSSFQEMQTLEINQLESDHLFVNSDTSLRFIRNGRVGAWQDHFSAASLQQFLQHHGTSLERLGYISWGITSMMQAMTETLEQSQARLTEIAVQQQQLKTDLQDAHTQLKQLQDVNQQQHQQLDTLKEQVSTLRARLQSQKSRFQQQQNRLKSQLEQAKCYISAMESSKFWRLRTVWLKFKNFSIISVLKAVSRSRQK